MRRVVEDSTGESGPDGAFVNLLVMKCAADYRIALLTFISFFTGDRAVVDD